jgi:hypothetical protein
VRRTYGSRGGKVSWLRWLGGLDTAFIFLDDVRLSNDWQISETKPGHLLLDLISVDLKSASTFKPPTESSCSKSAIFVLDYLLMNQEILRDINSVWMRLASHDPDDPRILSQVRSLIQILACSLDCGMEWMSTAIDCVDPGGVVQREDLQMREHLEAATICLWPERTPDHSYASTPPWLVFVNICIRNLFDLAKKDETLVTLDLGKSNRKAIAVVPTNLDSSKSAFIAIPAVLARSEYSAIRRL